MTLVGENPATGLEDEYVDVDHTLGGNIAHAEEGSTMACDEVDGEESSSCSLVLSKLAMYPH
jgi:hypothetical protein